MTPIAAFRDEQMARDFATFFGESAIVEQRDVMTLDEAETIATAAAQCVLDDVEALVAKAADSAADDSAEQITLSRIVDNLSNHFCADEAARDAIGARRAA
jgi:hypothetical protein